jgi:hypothetical protein
LAQQQITQKVFGLAFAGAQAGQSNTGLSAMLAAKQDQMFITGTPGFPERPAICQMFIQVERVP